LTQQEPRIFLCHAHEDKERVKVLYRQLKEAGYHPWLDKYDLLPGQKWQVEIRKMLSDHNNLVVVCLSNSSVSKRGTVQREIKWALDLLEEMPEGAIYLIPARLEECQVPEQLKELHWVDLFEPDGFEYLVRSLAFELGSRQPPAEPAAVERAPAAEPGPAPRQPLEPELIHIPAGKFLMGSDPKKDKDTYHDEQPQHRLHLPDYHIAKTPVTNGQYAVFAEATGRRNPAAGKADHPVVSVTWHDAMAYCQWLAKVTGKAYRLPSEAEWEKATRGTDGRIYPWGNEWDAALCNSRDGGPNDTTPVGQYSPQGDSPYGCVDMAGNVWEWTLSLYKPYPYDPGHGREDLKAGDDARRVLRGGSFDFYGRHARCAARTGYFPSNRYVNFGFRVCVAPQQE